MILNGSKIRRRSALAAVPRSSCPALRSLHAAIAQYTLYPDHQSFACSAAPRAPAFAQTEACVVECFVQILPWLSCPFRAVPQHSPHLLERTPSPHVPHRLEIAGGFFVSEAMRATCRLDIDAQHALERVALVCAGGKLFSFCHGTSSTQQPTAPIPALVHAAAARRPTLPRR